jgi:hypothetical protein
MSDSGTQFKITLTIVALLFEVACGGGSGSPHANANISLSPSSVAAGGPDLTLTVNSKQFAFINAERFKWNSVVWSEKGIETRLVTTFVSTSQLTAVVPAALVTQATEAQVRVENMGPPRRCPRSNI